MWWLTVLVFHSSVQGCLLAKLVRQAEISRSGLRVDSWLKGHICHIYTVCVGPLLQVLTLSINSFALHLMEWHAVAS